MHDHKIFDAFIATLSICAIEFFKDVQVYTPLVTFFIQLVIGILTIIYIFKKIKHFKP
jgi:hypothetical protein